MSSDPSGWLDGVSRFPTTLYGGYPDLPEDQMYPQAIVLHVAQGGFQALLDMSSDVNARASWHFSVSREGQRAQHVSLWDAAWHAGIVANPLPEAQRLIGQFGANPNRWSIGIEMEGYSVPPGYAYDYTYGPQAPWPADLVGAVIATIIQIRARCQWLSDLPPEEFVQRIITHSHVDQMTRRQDPGAYFMAEVMPEIRNHFLARPVESPAVNYQERLRDVLRHAEEIVRLARE